MTSTSVVDPAVERAAGSALPNRRPSRRGWVGYALIAPFFILFAAFGAYPLIFAIQLSFTDWRGSGSVNWIGLSNYTYLLTNLEFWGSLANSGVMWLLIVPIQTIAAVAVAALLSRSNLRFTKVLRTVVILPYVTPMAAMAQAFILLFDTNFGVTNYLLGFLGMEPIGWLTTTFWSKPTIALFVLWKTSGFALIIMLAAVQQIPGEVYEAAAIDGANRVRTFFLITVPLVRRSVAFFVVVSTLGISQMFLEPYVLTKGGPYTSSKTSGLYLYDHIGASDLGTGAANSFLLVILVLILSLAATKLLRSED
jgi:ABC-type sugar transport system permease subunit